MAGLSEFGGKEGKEIDKMGTSGITNPYNDSNQFW